MKKKIMPPFPTFSFPCPFPLLLLLLQLLFIINPSQAKFVLFDNTRPMLDSQGQIMDAHDGTIQQFSKDGPYYMHAVSYGLCQAPNVTGCDSPSRCGFRLDHNVSIYTSWDLSSGSWVFQGYAFEWTERVAGTLFRPSAAYNPNTDEYVLWWNYVHPNGTYAGYAVATSPTPDGPFLQRQASVNITYERSDIQAGDFHLFVDDDGTGYVIYSAGFWITIEELTPDYLSVTGRMMDSFRGNQTEYGWEAPVMFKRKGLYYIMYGPYCCFCYQGSGIRVYTAVHPLGPYEFQGEDIACAPTTAAAVHQQEEKHDKNDKYLQLQLPTSQHHHHHYQTQAQTPIPTPGQGCLFYSPTLTSTTRAQQNFVIEVQTPSGESEYLWTGDRWMQSPDGIKGHEPQFWVPLSFDKEGKVGRVGWVDLFVVDVSVSVVGGGEWVGMPVSVSER